MVEPRSRWADITGGDAGERYAARFAALAESGADVHGEARLCAELVPPGSRVLDAGCGTGRVAIRLAELGYDCVGVDLDESMLRVARRAAPRLLWILADLGALDLSLFGSGASPTVLDPEAPVPGPVPAPGPVPGPGSVPGPGVRSAAVSDSGAPGLIPGSAVPGSGDFSSGDSGPAGVRPFDLVVAAGNVIPLLAPGTEARAVAGLAALLRPGGLLVSGFGLDAAHLPLASAPVGLADYDAWCEAAGLTPLRRLATWEGAPYDGGGYAVSIHLRAAAGELSKK
ncbi:SAM-dependent methyltransferase [Streptosporangium becharense]|uniref:SAM-dependent methyltransferase n=1 Tax=Streptosporangium becharense TaxID=1816182 RepID=A0A7W9ILH2_9ACTN|nr:class I SAM-dependent methyltransferase [Streptosporangium becharense]MBB2915147.1 SAM-dependent methyltransferase [Streptosporangium becharense]MBB5822781.1 SAM-dependent methyltransferase [Streptosporangium becharense]